MSEKLPDGWTEQPLFLFAQIKHGYAFKSAYFREHGHYIVLTPGYFKEEGGMKIPNGKEKYYSAEFPKEFLLKKNDLLIAMTEQAPGLLGSTLFIPEDGVYLHNQRLGLIKINEKRLYPKYLHLYFSLQHVRLLISSMSGGTKVKHTSPDKLLSINIITPTLPEQQKIARILSTWDAAIDCTQKLLENSRQQKKALMQQLLTGKKRLPGFKDWETKKVGSMLSESRIVGSNGSIARKLTVKLYGNGVVAKNEKRSGSDSTTYYSRRSGQFIYSKLDFLNGAFGIVPEYLDGYESTLDVPTFDFKSNVNPIWFINYVTRDAFYKAGMTIANGGRKAKRVNPNSFLQMSWLIPTYKEQTAIAEVLSSCDAVIAQYEAKLANLQAQKKALMQQLLTGKRRVKVDEAAETPVASAS